MTTKKETVNTILQQHAATKSDITSGSGYAPSNIALCKYWGKRNSELNLPMTSSLSISLADKGAFTTLSHHLGERDEIYLNGEHIPSDHTFAKRTSLFLDLFRPTAQITYHLDTKVNIPVAAGLASSACGLAALILALDDLYGWRLNQKYLSILARLGSGSASRSLWHGFVEWHAGQDDHGLDSFAESLPVVWPQLRIGLHIMRTQPKSISSREAMQCTVNTSLLYSAWKEQVSHDYAQLRQAILNQDFELLGMTAEHNALAMHATMLSSWPPILYSQPETITAMRQIWELRQQGIPVYFTQDAGANLKLLFLIEDQSQITEIFPTLEIIAPFNHQ